MEQTQLIIDVQTLNSLYIKLLASILGGYCVLLGSILALWLKQYDRTIKSIGENIESVGKSSKSDVTALGNSLRESIREHKGYCKDNFTKIDERQTEFERDCRKRHESLK